MPNKTTKHQTKKKKNHTSYKNENPMDRLLKRCLQEPTDARERLVLICRLGYIDSETHVFQAQVESKRWGQWCDDLERSTDILRVQPADKYILCHYSVTGHAHPVRGRYAIQSLPSFTSLQLVDHIELTCSKRPNLALSFQLWRETSEETFTPNLYQSPHTVQLCISVTSSYRNHWNYILSKCKTGATKCVASKAPEQLMLSVEWTPSYLAQVKEQSVTLEQTIHQIVEHGKDLLGRDLDLNQRPQELPHQWHKVSQVCETYL